MKISTSLSGEDRSIFLLMQSCVFFVAIMGLVATPNSVLHASEPIRLTLTGELVVEPFINPPSPALEEVLGLASGDPIALIFDFDSSIQIAPGLPGQPQFGALVLDRFEAQIGGLNFQSDATGIDASIGQIGNSGVEVLTSFSSITETNQSDLLLGAISAVPTLINFQTADIGANNFGRFPLGLSGADVTSFSSGSLALSQAGDVSNVLKIDLTDVTVSSIPEPSSAVLMLVSFFAVATWRRR